MQNSPDFNMPFLLAGLLRVNQRNRVRDSRRDSLLFGSQRRQVVLFHSLVCDL